MVEESTMLIITDKRQAALPERPAGCNGIIYLHQELLPIADAGWRVVIGGATEVRSITVIGFDENDLGQLGGRCRFQIGLKTTERTEVVAGEDTRHPVKHHCKKRETLMIHAPTDSVLIEPIINQQLGW